MNDLLRDAFELFTGKPGTEALARFAGEASDAAGIRLALLSEPPTRREPQLDRFRRLVELNALLGARERAPLRVLIGSAQTYTKKVFQGWVGTNEEFVNLLRPEQWEMWFDPDSVDVMLAEHVWEHLDGDQAFRAALTCARFLKPGGRLRIAVPNGLHPNPEYRRQVGVGNKDGHRSPLTHATLCALLERVGFAVRLLEYWAEDEAFHAEPLSSADGHIGRSFRNDPRNAGGIPVYTSLIVDAIKPAPTEAP